MDVPHFSYLFFSSLTFGLSPLSGYCKQCLMLLRRFMYIFLSERIFLFILGIYLGLYFPSHVLTLCLTFKELSSYFPKWLYHFLFLPPFYECYSFSNTVIVCLILIIIVDMKYSILVWF